MDYGSPSTKSAVGDWWTGTRRASDAGTQVAPPATPNPWLLREPRPALQNQAAVMARSGAGLALVALGVIAGSTRCSTASAAATVREMRGVATRLTVGQSGPAALTVWRCDRDYRSCRRVGSGEAGRPPLVGPAWVV